MKDLKKKGILLAMILFACAAMAVVDGVIRPGYLAKSAIKIVLFLLLPVCYQSIDSDFHIKSFLMPNKKGFAIAAAMGLAVYAVVVGAFFLLRDVFDFSNIAGSVTSQNGVNKDNFLYVALYISFANSFLEEFFFRGFAFIGLKKYSGKAFAFVFSAAMFAFYHIAMMIGWFDFPVLLLTLVGLFAGGIIFNYFDFLQENIYLSWLIHMFANFATNTIGFILFQS